MTLIDTSVWIDHFRSDNRLLCAMLDEERVLTHPFVVGELTCGSLRNRMRILTDLGALPSARTATHEDVLHLIEDRKLWGKGIGWIDAHLLAAALISDCRLWSLDCALMRAATAVGVKSAKFDEREKSEA